ncbi:hypothetical protein LCGC14_2252780, partial [marine sediment metagenome]
MPTEEATTIKAPRLKANTIPSLLGEFLNILLAILLIPQTDPMKIAADIGFITVNALAPKYAR